jgi:hypothetical protein
MSDVISLILLFYLPLFNVHGLAVAYYLKVKSNLTRGTLLGSPGIYTVRYGTVSLGPTTDPAPFPKLGNPR